MAFDWAEAVNSHCQTRVVFFLGRLYRGISLDSSVVFWQRLLPNRLGSRSLLCSLSDLRARTTSEFAIHGVEDLRNGTYLRIFRILIRGFPQEYFTQSVGAIKKVELSYGPNSVSRGIANVTFSKPDGASKAFSKLNGLLVDGRPIKVEIVVGAAQAARVIPPPAKTLAERTSQPKAQPKSAASNKHNAAAAKNAGAVGQGKKTRRPRGNKPTKKTTEELDSEMADYFESANAGTNENANASAAPAPAAANGDAPMEDEIM